MKSGCKTCLNLITLIYSYCYCYRETYEGGEITEGEGVSHVACMGHGKNAYKFLVWKFEGKIPLLKPGVDRNTILK